jgi:hypothetical protein
MSGAIVGNYIIVALFIDQDAGRILSSMIDLIAEPSNAIVKLVIRDIVATGTPQGQSPTGHEADVIVDDPRIFYAI